MHQLTTRLKVVVGIAAMLMAVSAGAAFARSESAAPAPSALAKQALEIVRRDFYDPGKVPAFEAALSGEGAGGEEVAQALKGLGVSHTGRWTGDEIAYYELFDIFSQVGLRDEAKDMFPPEGEVTYAGIGLIPRQIEGKNFAAYVYDGSPAARAGILPGDEILSVNGDPLSEIGSFAGQVGKKVDVKLRRASGAEPMTLSTPVIAVQPTKMFREAIRNSVRVIERDGKRLGYVRLWTYAGGDISQLLTKLLTSAPLKDADGLLLDMRGRWGGAPVDAAEMFIGRAPLMQVVGKNGRVRTANMRWRKPVVGLIDAGTRSGMEILAYGLREAGVPLVGSRSAGAVLAGRAYLLNDNSLMLIAVLDVLVDGARLEGSGVQPTVEIPLELRYAAGADPQLYRAVEVLRARLEG